jgi:hypothetical protein
MTMRFPKKLNSSGISTVLGAILILGLIVTVLLVFRLTYLPNMKEQAEADHMHVALQDITDYKLKLDLAAQSGKGSITTTSIEMGGGSIPVIDQGLSSGTLTVDPSYGQLIVKARDMNGSIFDVSERSNLGDVIYRSSNNYWLNQEFHCEDGMVILYQGNGHTMVAEPDISVIKDLKSLQTSVVLNDIRIDGKPENIGSTGSEVIKSTLFPGNYSSSSITVKALTISITTDYAGEWSQYFENELKSAGLDEGTDYTISTDGRTVTTTIDAGTGYIQLSASDADFITGLDN